MLEDTIKNALRVYVSYIKANNKENDPKYASELVLAQWMLLNEYGVWTYDD